MRVLLVDNLMIRRYGNLRMGPGRKLMCGCVRNNYRFCEFSDRDMARLLAPIGIRKIGGVIANRKLVLTARNFRPDAILIGHCDYITNETLDQIREILPAVKIAHFNVDPIWQPSTRHQLDVRRDSCDALFVTTAGEDLKSWLTDKNVVAYMPNPSDRSMEHGDVSALPAQACAADLFFAGNPREGDPRLEVIDYLVQNLPSKLRFRLFGMRGNPSIWGVAYEQVLASSAMSINLNRKEGDKWYSSDRIAHLMGYGILTFLSDQGQMERFFSPGDCVFYSTPEDLVEKIGWYHTHDDARQRVAHTGRLTYHRLFSGERVLRFMLETLFGESYSESYEWAEEVYRRSN